MVPPVHTSRFKKWFDKSPDAIGATRDLRSELPRTEMVPGPACPESVGGWWTIGRRSLSQPFPNMVEDFQPGHRLNSVQYAPPPTFRLAQKCVQNDVQYDVRRGSLSMPFQVTITKTAEDMLRAIPGPADSEAIDRPRTPASRTARGTWTSFKRLVGWVPQLSWVRSALPYNLHGQRRRVGGFGCGNGNP